MATGSAAGSLAFRALGAELAITYVNDKTRTYVEPLAREAGGPERPPRRLRRSISQTSMPS